MTTESVGDGEAQSLANFSELSLEESRQTTSPDQGQCEYDNTNPYDIMLRTETNADDTIETNKDATENTENQSNATNISASNYDDFEQDETSRSLWQAVLACEEELAKDPSPQQMMCTAERIAQYYYCLPGRKDNCRLQRALDLAEKAENFRPDDGEPDSTIVSYAMYMRGRICRLLYLDTSEISWLHKAIKHSRDSVVATPNERSYRYLLSLRYDSLAMMLETLYLVTFTQGPDVQNDPELYNELLEAALFAAEYTVPEDYTSHLSGETTAHSRILRWFRVRYMGQTSENGTLDWDHMIGLGSRYPGSKWGCANASSIYDGPTPEQAWAVIEILARRWAHTRTTEHKEALLDYTRTNLIPDSSDESIFYELGRLSQSRLTGGEGYDCLFRFHLPTLNVTKALWEEYLALNEPKDGAFWQSVVDFNRNFVAVDDLAQVQYRIHKCTKNPQDAWAYDDLRWQAIRKMFLWQGWSLEASEYSFPAINPTPVVIAEFSAIDGETKIQTWWVPGMSLRTPRLRFLKLSKEDEAPKVDNWISDRTSDGRFVLGGAVKGRDDDVLWFLSGFSSNTNNIPAGESGT